MKSPAVQSACARPVPLASNRQRTRQEHAQETAQDYVELIAELIARTGAARVTDLARRLGVTHVTVNRTIQRLRRAGLVTALPYRSIFLTDSGRRLSDESRRRHEIVSEFLKSLGVPDAIALADAEGMEHHVSQETLAAFVQHLTSRRRPKR
ncbi:MAG TPA: manganese-binding transcriptional regulator MntR [Opitutaceae bacterium]|nr:manganese-binding transcriptional regulator MntR [Opitutaceae bacterium]